MILEVSYITFILITSYIYNLFLKSYILLFIPHFYYDNIIIALLLLIQLDNFHLYKELSDNTNEDKYIKIIKQQIEYINKYEMERIKEKCKYKKIHKSLNNLDYAC